MGSRLKRKANDIEADTKTAKKRKIVTTDEGTIHKKAQAFAKAWKARAKFKLPKLDEKNQTDKQAMVVGNDPDIKIDRKSLPTKPVMLVATSAFRVLEIAAMIQENGQAVKIVVIDNSRNVYNAWEILQSRSKQSSQMHEFFDEVEYFCTDPCIEPFSDGSSGEKLVALFQTIIRKFSFHKLQEMIASTVIKLGDWCDNRLMSKIKNIANHFQYELILYPSNIYSCLKSPDAKESFLRSIDILSPHMAIFSKQFFPNFIDLYPSEICVLGREQCGIEKLRKTLEHYGPFSDEQLFNFAKDMLPFFIRHMHENLSRQGRTLYIGASSALMQDPPMSPSQSSRLPSLVPDGVDSIISSPTQATSRSQNTNVVSDSKSILRVDEQKDAQSVSNMPMYKTFTLACTSTKNALDGYVECGNGSCVPSTDVKSNSGPKLNRT